MIKTCSTCQHRRRGWDGVLHCGVMASIDYVEGKVYRTCKSARSVDVCGPAGKLWSPTIWWRIARFFRKG